VKSTYNGQVSVSVRRQLISGVEQLQVFRLKLGFCLHKTSFESEFMLVCIYLTNNLPSSLIAPKLLKRKRNSYLTENIHFVRTRAYTSNTFPYDGTLYEIQAKVHV
jgi:hypothetical protein